MGSKIMYDSSTINQNLNNNIYIQFQDIYKYIKEEYWLNQ
jgi:hypothetical protein